MMPPPAPHAAGFTLLEVLVALVVFGLVLAGLAQGIQFGRRAAGQQAATIAAAAEMDAVDRVLRGLVDQMDPGTRTEPPFLAADAHRLAFTTALGQTVPGLAGAPPEADVALAVAAGRLVLRWTPHRHAQPLGPAPAPAEAVLLPGVARVDFQYWGAPGWVAAWPGPGLPALVRIRLVFAGAARAWPDIIEAPVLAGQASG